MSTLLKTAWTCPGCCWFTLMLLSCQTGAEQGSVAVVSQPWSAAHAHGVSMPRKPKAGITIPVNLCQLHSRSQLMQVVLVAHSVCNTSHTSLFSATSHWLPVGLGALGVHFLRCRFPCQLQRQDAKGEGYGSKEGFEETSSEPLAALKL